MQYALLIYGQRPDGDDVTTPIPPEVRAVLERPIVTGWARLHHDGSATTLRDDGATRLLTDGPFVETKEYLAGLIVIDVANLDAAIAVTHELRDAMTSGAIEIRPLRDAAFRGA